MATTLPLIPWCKTSILTCRQHLNSSSVAQLAALDLFVLGFPNQANTLLEAIHEHGLIQRLETTTAGNPKPGCKELGNLAIPSQRGQTG
jgi:hypothetical protein